LWEQSYTMNFPFKHLSYKAFPCEKGIISSFLPCMMRTGPVYVLTTDRLSKGSRTRKPGARNLDANAVTDVKVD